MKIVNENNDPMGGIPRIPVRFRAEASYDCDRIRAILAPWIVSWTESPDYLDTKEGLQEVPDRDVTMELRVDEFTRNIRQIQWVLSQVDDLHIAVQTMAYADEYTGERKWQEDQREVLEETVPSNRVLSVLLNNLRERCVLVNDVGISMTMCATNINAAWKFLGRQVLPIQHPDFPSE